jgi:hypothetical protein
MVTSTPPQPPISVPSRTIAACDRGPAAARGHGMCWDTRQDVVNMPRSRRQM